MTHTFTDLGYTSEGYKWGIATIAGSATLSSGAQSETIGHFQNIINAIGSIHDPMNEDDYIYEVNVTWSGSTITLTWNMQQASSGTPTWGNASDVSNAAIKVLCIGV
jgi:hypothetical protein